MTTFAYTALDQTGRRSSGSVEAASRDDAIAALTREGRFVTNISETRERRTVRPSGARVSRADVALFTRRLADLSDAGLPLDRVLKVVSEQSESARLSEIAAQALSEVRRGLPVSEALAMHPRIFPPVFTQTLRAGEASGQFPQVAGRLADFQEKEVARRSQILSALVYPAILTVTAIFVIVFLVTFVLPKLSGVFADLGGELPATTQFLLAATAAINDYGFAVLAAIALAAVAFRAWTATESGALARDSAILRLPLAGKIIEKAVVSRFSRVLGTLVYGGVPILESLRLASMAAGNRSFSQGATKVIEEVREGRPIAEAMNDAGGFPPVLRHMVAIGEESGDLPKMLGRVADSLDFEVDTGLRRLTALVEPMIVLTMGAFVGFVVLSVLLPIFQAQELVK